ncbi:flagellar M-ring protein FliF [Rhizorhabdus wittichii DC-6]|nr:flagellar M-ring protein FliF [Rhizorhabdus wittichii DC-6]
MASNAKDFDKDAAAGPARPAAFSLWLIAGLVFVILVAGYWLFIRTTYVPLLSNLAPQDAVEIVKVLDDRKVAYRLADEGRTILVASDKADSARIELVGSELPMRGQVGFELFNQSDMGLTEFAQKINYQRALQGELARTILLMDGIDAVRVHLGLPERGVFRDIQAQPKASVTLVLKPGTTLTESTVAGIQRLVAGAIPDMPVDNVAVLDGTGRIISSDLPAAAEPTTASDAILENYRARISAAIGRLHPSLRYHLGLSFHPASQPASGGTAKGDEEPSPKRGAAPRGDPDFAVSVRLTTAAALDESQRLELLQLIRETIGFDERRGDGILFLVGPIPPDTASIAPDSPDRVVARTAPPAEIAAKGLWETYWPLAAIAIAVLLVGAWIRDRRRSGRRRQGELMSFTEELRERLKASDGVSHGG